MCKWKTLAPSKGTEFKLKAEFEIFGGLSWGFSLPGYELDSLPSAPDQNLKQMQKNNDSCSKKLPLPMETIPRQNPIDIA